MNEGIGNTLKGIALLVGLGSMFGAILEESGGAQTLAVTIAGGSTVCSHFNDSGFWLVKSLVGMDEKTTLKTWTIMETLVGGVGFLVALVISFFA